MCGKIKGIQSNTILKSLGLLFGIIIVQFPAFAQQNKLVERRAVIVEEKRKIKTYPFSDPDPTSILGYGFDAETIYPYFKYDGFTRKSEYKDWTIVEL